MSVVTPSKIVCVGRNYAAHARELGNEVPERPMLFFKPPSSLLSSGAAIVLPRASTRVEFEGEIGGFTCVNDVTARDLQKTDGQWARAKGFDTFCPAGPRVAQGLDWRSLEVITRVNGEERQRGRTTEMHFAIPDLLAYISGVMTLEVGDLVATGTPAGVGPLADGDSVEVEIPGIGVLSNPVTSEA
jgi:2-keto-4-pentenoate hydratase/2-oxohepta-3-ene-1,7-dioic acid hydratase in catechol pathway